MSRRFGRVFQNGYVVRDLRAALDHWTRVLGVGPFFVLENVPIPAFRYRGKPSPAAVSLALGFSGDLEIELIEPVGDAPSMYRNFIGAGREGLQHLGYFTPAYGEVLADARAAGIDVVQEGTGSAPGTRFCYLDTEAHPGTVVELIEASPASEPLHAMIRDAATAWDGRDPVRLIRAPAGVGT